MGLVDRKNTINCYQVGLQNRHMHWRDTKNIFNGVFAKVLDLFEDRFAVFMFELVSSVKHGNIHKCSVSVMSDEVHFLVHATNKKEKFLGASESDSASRPLCAMVRPVKQVPIRVGKC